MSGSHPAAVAARAVGLVAGVVGVLVPLAGAVVARRAAALYATPDVVPAAGLEPVSVGGLPGWLRPGGDGTTWAVFLPGLGSHPLRHQEVADAFVDRGDTVLFASHSARHPARRHGFGLREQGEALAWLRFAAERGATEVALLGWSFGASLWLRLLAGPLPVRVRSVVLTGPLADWDATVAYGAGGGPTGRVAAAVMRWTLRVPGLASVAGQDRPVRLGLPEVPGPAPSLLVVHGDADRTVPLESSRALVASWPGAARLHVVAGAAHGGERDTNPTGWLDVVARAV